MALNLNVGILGHVDSGKTSLAKILSSTSSTAAFDKNPQSQERGITLDLGFSSFTLPMPEHLKESEFNTLQFTLVDCPGHASLIKTIIGGSQIIDMIILVIDATKGIQTQTAECLVIGEITCKKMIIVLNKIDLFEEEKRPQLIEKVIKKLRQALKPTIFNEAPVVSVSANPNNGEPIGIKELIEKINTFSFIPQRSDEGPFLFAVDHCFSIKGQGTVMTGTVLQGGVKLNDVIDIPHLGLMKKVKSMQMFRKPVQAAKQGDRLGICVTQFDPKLMERGVACTPGHATFITCAIVNLNKVKYFKFPIRTKSKLHITIGHETTMATVTIFSSDDGSSEKVFDLNTNYKYVDNINTESDDNKQKYFAILEFEKPILAIPNCTIIASKLDTNIHANVCRIAFWGNLLQFCTDKDYKTTFLPKIKIYKSKAKSGILERVVNEHSVIVKGLFKKETNIEPFVGLNVKLSTGENGKIDGPFGQSGKVKIAIHSGLSHATLDKINTKLKYSKNDNMSTKDDNIMVHLNFMRFVYDANKKMIQ